MWVILLEALLALVLLCFIVWWTMFSGRRKGERRSAEAHPDDGRGRPGAGDEPDSRRPPHGPP
jgi:hypothetical protein